MDKKLYQTPFLGETPKLIEIIKKAQVDTERNPIESALAEWFYHILVMDGVDLSEVPNLKFKSSHICEEDLKKIKKYIDNYPSEDSL